MQPEEYRRMAEFQDRHWWFEAKRRGVAALLSRHAVAVESESSVLEVGAGTGSMLGVMTSHGRTFAMDAYLPALELLRDHRPDAAAVPVAAELGALPFAAASFGLVGCFDVLYHQGVDDVGGALAELHRVCEPGGYLAITDSAFPLLRSSHDVATHAARRFRLPELTRPLTAAGFTIVHATYFHTFLFPIAAAVRIGKRLLQGSPDLHAADGRVKPRSDLAPVRPWLNALLRSIYGIEIPLAIRARMPFGVSLMILARRAGGR